MTVIINNTYCNQWAKGLIAIDNTTATNNRFLIYKGTMPTNLTDWVEADDSANLLVTFNNFIFSSASNNPVTQLLASPSPNVVNASATGTAAWYAWVNGGLVTRYLFGDVTLAAGTGSLTIDSLSLTSGNPVTFGNWSVEHTTT